MIAKDINLLFSEVREVCIWKKELVEPILPKTKSSAFVLAFHVAHFLKKTSRIDAYNTVQLLKDTQRPNISRTILQRQCLTFTFKLFYFRRWNADIEI